MATEAVQTKSWKHNLFILESLVTKDFKLKYRRSVLGVLWSVLNPLLMMLVLTAVFSFMFRFTIVNYPLYLILGTILFDMMSRSTSASMTSIIEAAPLIKKIRVEKSIFPVEKILFELLNFAISLVAVAAVMLYYQVAPTTNLFFLPLLLMYMVIFCSGVGLLLAALAVFFRDTIHLWGVIVTAWTYATPLFYPFDMLPDWMQQAMAFNPMYHYVTYFRDIMMWNTNPGVIENLICLGMAVATLIVGLFVFRKLEHKFILYV
ncbi:ABC transporter permease [Eggerthella guodeyinii]|uniref:Transport permease protein n=1 Tax=Eggerthella guodeyinii TaxID=2690837 RepID=A0A6L7IWF8_9ACTN|nr:ABC transporter permease [Eggerthella guodeyinii]QOS67184.1 ABC transporter permease [Eggerthella guodeyinii]